MAQIEPSTYGGYGRQKSSGIQEISRGGLQNLVFSSRCPPDVQPNTRVIAVCGITDFSGPIPTSPSSSDTEATSSQPKKAGMTLLKKGKELFSSSSSRKERKKQEADKAGIREGLASPRKDGWFFSDFYLFHHLFRGLGKQAPPTLAPAKIGYRYPLSRLGDGNKEAENMSCSNVLFTSDSNIDERMRRSSLFLNSCFPFRSREKGYRCSIIAGWNAIVSLL